MTVIDGFAWSCMSDEQRNAAWNELETEALALPDAPRTLCAYQINGHFHRLICNLVKGHKGACRFVDNS